MTLFHSCFWEVEWDVCRGWIRPDPETLWGLWSGPAPEGLSPGRTRESFDPDLQVPGPGPSVPNFHV
jgi:hypothetical protein